MPKIVPFPLLLIHGIDDTPDVFQVMVAYLRDRGWSDLHTLALTPNNGDVGLEKLARQIQDYVDHALCGRPFDLLGFSMGGIVSRYYLQRLGGLSKVRRFLTLASPHRGTWMAYFRANCGAAQMRPGSTFLEDLNRTAGELEQLDFVSLWTPYDLMIVPADSSIMPVGRHFQVPVLAHPWMLTDARSLHLIAEILGQA